jgi:hypothetical protein
VTPDRAWPTATLDPLRRARVLAAAWRSAAIAETTLEAPFAETWDWITDLPHSVPAFDRDVTGIEIRSRAAVDGGEDLAVTVHTHGVPWPFGVRLEDGFCVMTGRARAYLVVMAAMPDPDAPDRTRFAHVEAVPVPGTGLLRPVLTRLVAADVANLRRLARAGFRRR